LEDTAVVMLGVHMINVSMWPTPKDDDDDVQWFNVHLKAD